MNGTRQLLLGIFFLVAFGILGVYTLYLYELSWFGDRTVWQVEFPEANGLRVGDGVRASGMRIGRVTRMTFDPGAPLAKRINVTVSLETPVVLHEGYAIRIEETTLLGGRNIDIDTGPPGAPVLPVGPDDVLVGTLESPPLDALADLVVENREALHSILENADAIVAGVRAGNGPMGMLVTDEEVKGRLGSGIGDFATFMGDAKSISADIRAGKGTLGRLFTEEELYESARRIGSDLEASLGDLKVLAADLEAGRGTVGRLLRDDGLADTVQKAVEDLQAIVDKVKRGEGTLGRLVTDDAIAERIQSIATKIDQGEGVLGALIADDEMYRNLSAALSDLSDVVAKVKSGEGTVGRLIQDDEVYAEILAAAQLLTRSLEDYREAAPVSTFTSVLFGAF